MQINSHIILQKIPDMKEMFLKAKNTLSLSAAHSETQSLDYGFYLLLLQMSNELRQFCKYTLSNST